VAGLYAFLGPPDPQRLNAAAARLRFFDETVTRLHGSGWNCVWVSHDAPHLFGPAWDPETGVYVVSSGRVAWDEEEWQRSERLERFTGGLSNRLLLETYLARGVAGIERHNGSAAVMVFDPRVRTVHLFTDQFGYHPVFVYRPRSAAEVVIATVADAIASDGKVRAAPEVVAIAEFLSAWRITPPHTYYRDIEHAGAAVHWTWNVCDGSVTSRTYWRPFAHDPFPAIGDAGEELTRAVRVAIRRRTLPRLGPVACYASGGMDSRLILFGAADPEQLTAVNLYDVPNQESAVARRLADAAGVEYLGIARDPDYYPRWLSDGARISGAMWSAEDNHFLGTRPIVMSRGARTVMTACTADWLFKGYGLETRYVRLFGKNLPLKVFTNERVNGFLPNWPRPVPPQFRQPVRDRLDTWFGDLPRVFRSDRERLVVEDRRVRPVCYTVSVSGPVMYRAFPYDSFLADRSVADCYGRTRAAWKLNSELWARVVQQICTGAKHIEDANFGWRIGRSTPARLTSFAAGWMRRRLGPAGLDPNGLATAGSWPNLGWYARHSPTMKSLWEATPTDVREIVTAAWGSDPWRTPLEGWQRSPNDLFRIMTVAEWLKERLRSHDEIDGLCESRAANSVN
jgi:asparagine synthase (glutamine-hydrolysing)